MLQTALKRVKYIVEYNKVQAGFQSEWLHIMSRRETFQIICLDNVESHLSLKQVDVEFMSDYIVLFLKVNSFFICHYLLLAATLHSVHIKLQRYALH